MTYIDTLDQADVEAALVKMRLRNDFTIWIERASGDERFALWLLLVDRRISRAVGIGLYDLGDTNTWDSYTAGDKPWEHAQEALANDDTFGVMFD